MSGNEALDKVFDALDLCSQARGGDAVRAEVARLRAVETAARRLLDVLPVRYDGTRHAGYELPALPPDDAIRQYRALRDALEAKP